MNAIELVDVSRRFDVTVGTVRRERKQVIALRDLSLVVPQGQLFGLLGPNGAGKTTTIKILTTLLVPTSGRARVLGYDVASDPQPVRRRIGFVFGGERGLYYRLSARDNLRYFAELYSVSPSRIGRRIDWVLDLVSLRGRADERVEGYSRGMKQRLHLARMLLHDPDVLFLDEPTAGLDPIGAQELRQTIRDLRAAGKTLILTTHYLFEADMLCDRIGIIDAGHLLAEGTATELKRLVGDLNVVELETFGVAPAALDRLRALELTDSVAVEQRGLRQVVRVQTSAADLLVPRLLAALPGVEVGRVSVRAATLEDAYVRLVGRLE